MFLISLCWFYDLVGQHVRMYMYVSMSVGLSRLALFICISGTIFWNLIKLCRNITLGFAVILPFHDLHLRGQTNVAYV